MFSRAGGSRVAQGGDAAARDGAAGSGPCSTVLGMTEAEVITEIGERLAAAVPAGSQVVLFGSRARGEAGARSDYDLLVIEPSVENVAVESTRLRDELDDLRAPIDVVVVAEDVARRRAVVRGTVVDRALREGRVLVAA
jgi:predicted nucleotidyltransferase